MDIFSALADPTRRSILEMLAQRGELTATQIYDQFPVSRPAVSQHLKVLREANLVRVEKQAQQRLYRINPVAMMELEGWARQLMNIWNRRFDALEQVIETEKAGRSSPAAQSEINNVSSKDRSNQPTESEDR